MVCQKILPRRWQGQTMVIFGSEPVAGSFDSTAADLLFSITRTSRYCATIVSIHSSFQKTTRSGEGLRAEDWCDIEMVPSALLVLNRDLPTDSCGRFSKTEI